MPALSIPVKNLVKNARFTAAEFANFEKKIARRQVSLKEAEIIAINYADTLEAGVGSWLNQLLDRLGSRISVAKPIVNLADDTDLLRGEIILPDSGRRHPSVRNIQRGLIAVASRTKVLDFMLPEYGADGIYGGETSKAVKAFQDNHLLPITGKVDKHTAKALDEALRTTHVPGTIVATPPDIASAGVELCTGEIAQYYGVPQPWINNDPRHNVPTGIKFDYLINRWKCNLFGGNVLRKGGYEPPYYRDNTNDGKGEYPNANQWFKWTDKYAPRYSNPVRFDLIAEVPAASLPQSQARKKIEQLFSLIQAGDFLMVDHPGSGVQDGGHTRVAVKSDFHTLGTVSFAQARYEKALILHESVDDLVQKNEENIWLMRPNTRM
ncbi:MAG: peptidoglycan-binding domain-containing protein [Cyanobacteriota bacterium]|nr:peptidoglycan-binding domain-containing protein [Cyanobacteriota bacterium]